MREKVFWGNSCLLVFVLLLLTVTASVGFAGERIIVGAAASLTDAFKEIGESFEKKYAGVEVLFNFGASGALASLIEQGAPLDVFASASEHDMDRLEKKRLIKNETRIDFANNSLVVITPQGKCVSIRNLGGLLKPEVKWTAIGNPETTPGGRYAMQALKKAGVLDAVRDKLVYGNDIRQARAYVMRKEVDAAVVFASDWKMNGVRLAFIIPESLHSKITYPAVVVRSTNNGELAKRFVSYLQGKEAQAILMKYGFKPAQR